MITTLEELATRAKAIKAEKALTLSEIAEGITPALGRKPTIQEVSMALNSRIRSLKICVSMIETYTGDSIKKSEEGKPIPFYQVEKKMG